MNQKLGQRRWVRQLSALVVGVVLSQPLPVLAESKDENVSYSDFIEHIEARRIKTAKIYEKQRIAEFKLKGQPEDAEYSKVILFDKDPELFSILRENKVDFEQVPDPGENPYWASCLNFCSLSLLFFCFLYSYGEQPDRAVVQARFLTLANPKRGSRWNLKPVSPL